ncbi:MAG TPA: acetylglutamate kinase [Oculatellaceae cyanobacterium]
MTSSLMDQKKTMDNVAVSPSQAIDKSVDGQVVVVKFGGNAVQSATALETLIEDTITLVKQGVKVIVVHGGGTAVNDALAAIGKKTEKVNGLRVTDSETLSVAVKTFVELNEQLTERFREKGGNALSFSSKSANPLIAEKMGPVYKGDERVDLGWVGDIVSIDQGLLESWLWAGWIPIVAPLGLDIDGHYYNINADHVALAVAAAIQADRLIFLTDVPGVLQSLDDPTSIIRKLTPEKAAACIDSGIISGGMLPKLKSCITGLSRGIQQIAILNSFESHALMKGFTEPEATGTLITGEEDAD